VDLATLCLVYPNEVKKFSKLYAKHVFLEKAARVAYLVRNISTRESAKRHADYRYLKPALIPRGNLFLYQVYLSELPTQYLPALTVHFEKKFS